MRYQLRYTPNNGLLTADAAATYKCQARQSMTPLKIRRGDRIRTCDPLVPNQMRYQLRYTPNNGLLQLTLRLFTKCQARQSSALS